MTSSSSQKMIIPVVFVPEQDVHGKIALNRAQRNLRLSIYLTTRFNLQIESSLRAALNSAKEAVFNPFIEEVNNNQPPQETKYYIKHDYIRELGQRKGQLAHIAEIEIELPEGYEDEKSNGYPAVYDHADVLSVKVFGPRVINPERAFETWKDCDWGELSPKKKSQNISKQKEEERVAVNE